jgi:hypothetical protein
MRWDESAHASEQRELPYRNVSDAVGAHEGEMPGSTVMNKDRAKNYQVCG